MVSKTRAKQPKSDPLPKARILVVDDEAVIRAALQRALRSTGYDAVGAEDGDIGLKMVAEQGPFDVALVDIRMPNVDGMTFLERACVLDPGMMVVIMTGQASVATAVRALKLGAYDYLTKPFDDIFAVCEELLPRAIELSQQRRSMSQFIVAELDDHAGVFEGMIGRSKPMRRVFEMLAGVAPTDATVLIQGETGTGKELVAKAIHRRSGRHAAPFVAINCAALSSELLESELFGHEKGAFTGAYQAKEGLFEEAHEGTLFLDEIAEMSAALQAKLLRVLQEGEIRRVGSGRTRAVDVRIIAATHQDLREARGAFREDLYYRLAVVTIMVPPLRQRGGDIPLMAGRFLKEFSQTMGRGLKGFTSSALAALQMHRWEGNVRELRNVIERGAIFARGEWVEADDLPELLASDEHLEMAQRLDLTGMEYIEAKQLALNDFEKHYLKTLLDRTAGNISQAARHAGMDRSNFRRLLKRQNISKADLKA